MSPNPYPLFTVFEQEQTEQIKTRIGLLIRLYLKDKNQQIAKAVEEHINVLLTHPGFSVEIEQRCQFRRLATHWRYLAWVTDFKKTDC